MSNLTEAVSIIADIGIRLGAAEDLTNLLDTILTEAMRLTQADGGSLYLLKENQLEFEIVKNHSLKINYGGPSSQPVPDSFRPITMSGNSIENVCVWVAKTQKTKNIPDISLNRNFDFSGTRRADARNQYSSVSFLTVAMRDHEGKTVGVLQLINALDENRTPIPFESNRQKLVEALAGMAAVAINNHLLRRDLSNLLDAFMSLIAEGIDEKSAYTGGHCRRVPKLVMAFAEKVHGTQTGMFKDLTFTPEDMYELRVAAWLHDVGKIAIPEYIVDKATKLETIYDRIHEVSIRGELLKREREIELLKKSASASEEQKIQLQKEYEAEIQKIDETILFLRQSNYGSEFMTDEDIDKIHEIASWDLTINGKASPFLPGDFVYNLTIRKGTLTNEERKVINNHINITINMLNKLPFPDHLKRVPEFAGGHHERMDGRGYPFGLKRDEMSVQARMMAIADIFEALTASDRPYKKAKTLTEALNILGKFKEINHIDPDLFDVFVREEVYLSYAKEFMATDMITYVDKERLIAIEPQPMNL